MARTFRGKYVHFGVRVSSQDERRVKVGSTKITVFADFVALEFGNPVEAQVVFPVLISATRSRSSASKRRRSTGTQRPILYPLADAFAEFSNAPQTSATFACFSIDVVADNDQHDQRTRGRYSAVSPRSVRANRRAWRCGSKAKRHGFAEQWML